MNGFALGEIAVQLGGELVGDAALRVDRLGSLERATRSTLCFVASERFRAQIDTTQAGCIVVAPALREAAAARGAAIVTPDPHLYYARLSQWWAKRTRARPAPGVHASAQVDPLAHVDASASVGPLCVVEAGARIGARAVLGAHCVIGAGASIGEDSTLEAHVSFGAGCTIGARGIVHGGAVIGADGFGFAPSPTGAVKIPQAGIVIVEDDVEIGANTTVDRATLEATIIRRGAKLDNLVMIAHNCEVGAHSFLAAQVGIAGSTKIGRGVQMGGQAGAAGHLTIGDGVQIAAQSGVPNSVPAGKVVGGYPAMDVGLWRRTSAAILRLPELLRRVRRLERRLGAESGPEEG